VLGLVIEHPGYGYQLAQRLDERCGSWGWERTGVYGALDSLARDGHLYSREAKASGKSGRAAPRLVYEATQQGLDFFRSWMCSQSTPGPVRQELDLKLLFSRAEYLPTLVDQTWSHEQHCLNQLNRLTSTEHEHLHGTPLRPPSLRELGEQLQLDAEVRLLQVRIEWLRDVRNALREYLDTTAIRARHNQDV
jgi:DNA-binding PadR family transcriptional regulator